MLEQNKKLLFEFMDKFEKSSLSEFELQSDDIKFCLKKSQAANVVCAPAPVMAAAAVSVQPASNVVASDVTGNAVKSPIVGVYYGAPSPDSPSFVKIGDTVKRGDVLCIVEAMKMMNEIVSDFDGVVKELPVSNGDLVEFGQVLAVIE